MKQWAGSWVNQTHGFCTCIWTLVQLSKVPTERACPKAAASVHLTFHKIFRFELCGLSHTR